MRESVNVTYSFLFLSSRIFLSTVLHPFATFTRLDYHFFLRKRMTRLFTASHTVAIQNHLIICDPSLIIFAL